MKDIIVRKGCSYICASTDQYGSEIEIIKNLDDMLPVDRVVTIDCNGYVSLYDTCVKIEEDMIEKEL